MQKFSEMGLKPEILDAIEDLGFEQPTPIQEEVIPIIFESNRDIVGLAQTGTGKTAAFGLPVINNIDTSNPNVQALVLAPTRELSIQIAKDFNNYSKYIEGLKIVSVYGGASIENQIRELKRGAHVICATPGRILDLIKRGVAKIEHIQTVVLDEADEMLNMGFRDDLDDILSQSPQDKRTFLFSATMPDEVARISSNYMTDPIRVTIGQKNSGTANVTHKYYQVHAKNRYLALKRIVDINPDIYGIVFCRTRQEAKEVADNLMKDGYNADALHGDLSQAQRDYVMNRFRERSLQMLVATDVAARGIDVNDITHVINYNLPEDVEVYTHRSGRTGRAGKTGCSISIVNYRERSKISQIEKIIKQPFQKHSVPSGEEICHKQLMFLIDRMQNVVVDEEEIASFMDVVNKKLENFEKEDIVKRFVSLEFNRFLTYYKDAEDLNEPDPRRDRKSRADRKDRGSRTDGAPKAAAGFTRFFINVGKKDRVSPKNIIGMINDATHDRDIAIGQIDLKETFSFFEVGEQYTSKLLKSFNGISYNGRDVRVEVASGDNNSRGGKQISRHFDKSDRPRRSEQRSEDRFDRGSRNRQVDKNVWREDKKSKSDEHRRTERKGKRESKRR